MLSVVEIGPHKIMCGDSVLDRDELIAQVGVVDVIYTDPPWNDGVVKMFYRRAGLAPPGSFEALMAGFLGLYAELCPDGPIVVEMGFSGFEAFYRQVQASGALTCAAATAFYGGRPYVIWVGTFGEILDVTVPDGLRDEESVNWVIETFVRHPTQRGAGQGTRFCDPCCGVGLQLLAAFDAGATVFGCELDPKKVARLVRAISGDHGCSRATCSGIGDV